MQNGFVHQGSLNAKGFRFAVILSRFNAEIGEKLLEGACEELHRLGANAADVEVFKVPGAFEIPVLASVLAHGGKFNAILALGTVIRGETPHFEYVCDAALAGINHVAMTTRIPVANGIITANTKEQAVDRTGGRSGHLGIQAAQAAVEMATLLRQQQGKNL